MNYKSEKRLRIFVTNDDGINAKGISALIEMVKPYGEVYVLAPMSVNSGMSQAVTISTPIRLKKISETENIKIYACTGTPTDCVKLAFSHILPNKEADILVSGINHGSNSSASVLYSGTLAATTEGIMYHTPSIGFSLCDYTPNADFSACISLGRKIIDKVLNENFGIDSYLNVNFPKLSESEIKGIKICRQAKGVWREEFEKRTDPQGNDYYWLTGDYVNEEPNAVDTDETWLAKGYVTIVPQTLDMTNYAELDKMKTWNL
ncbi:MAG: 5'/3'-nucleotidase SurE [Prevotellaceae bacterium]|jgi:5'-nucleotidase|nr:5'/3'-nucleotidase SurE [Prevotellaceae bacterium]